MLRIVVAALGSDPQDHEAQVLARALRDAGHEVIFTGMRQTPEQLVETAIAEDADLVGLSVGSGSHLAVFRRLTELLAERDAADIAVFGAGTVPEEDLPALAGMGVSRVLPPAATTGEITGWVAEQFPEG